MRHTGNLKDLRAEGLFLTVPRIPLPKMEVVSGVLFLPRPLDLNGTEFSPNDGEERQGGGALAGSWLLFRALEVQVQIRLQESCSPFFFCLYTMKLL